MRGIIDAATGHRRAVVAAAVVLALFGAWQLRRMPVEVLPEFSPPTVEVQTEALGLSPVEVEQLVTVPLEQDLLNGVARLATIRSRSVPSLSSIELVFERGTDLFQARQVVQERLTQAHALPNVSKPPTMLQPLSSTSRVMMIGLSSRSLSPIEVSRLARWTIRPRLMGVPGVAGVAIWGQRERQLQVQVDPERLRAHGVSLDQVVKTTGNATFVSPLTFLEASTPGTGGFVDTSNQRLGVQHILPIHEAKDLAQVTVDDREGPPLRLGDVASVVEDHQPLIGDAVLGEGDSLLLVVDTFPGTNTLDVTHRLQVALDSLRPGLAGLQLDPTIYQPARYIRTAMGNLASTVLIGLALALALVGLVLRRWRTALVCAASVPLSLVAAVVVLHARGASLNPLVLAGLALGVVVVVDDAVSATDHVRTRLAEHRTHRGGRPPASVVGAALLESAGASAWAAAVVVVGALPAFFLHGLPSATFVPTVAVSYLLAVAASLAVSMTVTPALLALLRPPAPGATAAGPAAASSAGPGGAPLGGAVGGRLQRAYDTVMRRSAATVGPLVAAVVLVAVGLAALTRVHQSLLPTFEDSNVLVHWDGAAGTSLPEMRRVTGLVAAELRSLRGVRNVGAHVGRAITGDQVVGANSAELWARIDPGADHHRVMAAIEHVVDGYPGFRRQLVTYPGDRVDRVLAGTDPPVAVRLYGLDLDVLRNKAEEIKDVLSRVDGIEDEQVDQQATEPTIQVEVDLGSAERFGVKPGDVRRAAATLLSGIEVGSLFEDQKVFEVVVRGVPALRDSLSTVKDLLIGTPSGSYVHLGDVARVQLASVPDLIAHQDTSRSIDITADVSGRDVRAVMRDVERRLRTVDYPMEYHAELLGGYEAHQAAQHRLLALALAAAVAVLLLLQAAYGSWRLAVATMLCLPVALVGGVLAILADGGTASLGAAMGLFAVLAITVRHCVASTRAWRRLEEDEGELFGLDLVLRGARERAGPVTVTMIVVTALLLPAMLSGGAGREVLGPMATVVMGGLVTSTAATLLLLPTLHLRMGRPRQADPTRALAGAPTVAVGP